MHLNSPTRFPTKIQEMQLLCFLVRLTFADEYLKPKDSTIDKHIDLNKHILLSIYKRHCYTVLKYAFLFNFFQIYKLHKGRKLRTDV